MISKSAAISLALLFGLFFSGCGESNAKRSADARAEVVAFFGVDAPVVAFLRPDSPAELAAVDRAASGIPAWQRFRGMIMRPLHAAEIGRARLLRLVQPRENVEGIDAAALALGAATPGDLAAGRALLVLATDQADLLSEFMHHAASDRALRPAGSLDEAALYEGDEASFAVRDGVLVSAPTIGAVRAALRRRDGNSDEQLDNDAVASLFDRLEQTGPLLVYADLGSVREADRGLRAFGVLARWTGLLDSAAASARVEGGALAVEAYAKATGDLAPAQVPLGAEPSSFEITRAKITSLIAPGPSVNLVAGLAPISGQATTSSDEVRMHVTVGG